MDRDELRKGLARTWPYLLSHHTPSELYRCYAPELRGRRVHLCARCTGIYPGILAGLATGVLTSGIAQSPRGSLLVVLLVPLPALVDWAVTTFGRYRGYNAVRTATGLLLGFAYGIGLYRLVLAGDLRILLVGVVYAILAGGLIALSPDP